VPVPDVTTVKEVLARLARDPAGGPVRLRGRRFGGDDYRTVIDEACAAVESLADAAAFVDRRGVDGLEDAVEAAREAGDHAAARRGHRVAAAFAAVRTATQGGDHFRSGRGTTLGGDTKERCK